ncbi:hypothetical protein MN608_05913 [Microdochium nivale]|nr:hypothetical protein MN608_05913 [Microdochium nivale]
MPDEGKIARHGKVANTIMGADGSDRTDVGYGSFETSCEAAEWAAVPTTPHRALRHSHKAHVGQSRSPMLKAGSPPSQEVEFGDLRYPFLRIRSSTSAGGVSSLSRPGLGRRSNPLAEWSLVEMRSQHHWAFEAGSASLTWTMTPMDQPEDARSHVITYCSSRICALTTAAPARLSEVAAARQMSDRSLLDRTICSKTMDMQPWTCSPPCR